MAKEIKDEKRKCIKCSKKYEEFMLSNYNLGLCRACFDTFEKEGKIERDSGCDEVKHKVTCPECGRIYEKLIVDEKCKTKGCDVWFFWDDLDCVSIARWIKKK